MGARQRSPEQERFERMWVEHGPAVRSFVRRRVRFEEVDDLMAATAMTAWVKFEGVEVSSHRAWLMSLANGHVLNLWRARQRSTQLMAGMCSATQHTEIGDRFDSDDLSALLDILRPTDRTIVMLTAMEGRSAAEVAQLLGLQVGAVRTRLSRARRQLRDAWPGRAACSVGDLESAS